MENFVGKKFLVTGASSGIGEGLARYLASQGAQLFLVGRSQERLAKLISQIDGEKHRVEGKDLSKDIEDIPAWMKSIGNEFGSFDGLVHCAGIQAPMPIRACSLEHWRKVTSINLDVSFMLLKGLRQRGVKAEEASVVFISSVMSKAGEPSLAPYCASKAGLDGLVRAAALELASERIRINSIAPGMVNTPLLQDLLARVGTDAVNRALELHPLGIGEVSDTTNAICFLLSSRARWITGTTLVVDGGYLAR